MVEIKDLGDGMVIFDARSPQEKKIAELQAKNKLLKKQIGDLRAAAVRKGLMRGGCFTGKT